MSFQDQERFKLRLKYPASWPGNGWREALPVGNGRLGAAVYGAVYKETVVLQHAELWHGGRRCPLPDVASSLAETRALMDQGEYDAANRVLSDALLAAGYDSELYKPLPLADLNIVMKPGKGFRSYARELDLASGVASVRWVDGNVAFRRDLFVSRADDLLVCRISFEETASEAAIPGGAAPEVELGLTLHDPQQSHPFDPKLLPTCVDRLAEDGYIRYAARSVDGTDFGAVLKVVPFGGRTEAADGRLSAQGASGGVLALAAVFVGGDRRDEWHKLKEKLDAVEPDYGRLLARHAELHGELFHSADFSLELEEAPRSNEELLMAAYEGETPNELTEKMWAYGRYLFVSSTREDGLPCPLYGLWCGDYDGLWSHHMANENVQMIYWHALPGGLSALVPALFNHYDGLMDDFRDNARKLFGCRGIYIPAGTTPGLGLPNQIVPVIMNWTGAAGWLARHYYEYYSYTGDVAFLRDRALPFMRETALFYEDFLTVGADGRYRIYPSVSPENSPGNFAAGRDADQLAHPMPSAADSAMDFAILKELLGNLLEGAKQAGMYEEEWSKWEGMSARIPPYRLNQTGAVAEWGDVAFEDNDNHRHMSHIYPLFPGNEVDGQRQPELFEAFAKAVRSRQTVGLSDQSGWSLAHMSHVYARLEDAERAMECLDLLTRSCLLPNLFLLHNDWRNMGICLDFAEAPFQIDANMGFTSAVQEMLLQASPGRISLLPALPERWRQGRAGGLRFPTGTVKLEWNADTGHFRAELKALRDTAAIVRIPGRFGACGWHGDWNGETGTDSGAISVAIPAGGTLTITAAAPDSLAAAHERSDAR
ncbi:glycosyl hydrolase family 95 catalytic domain-containing protein [Cohnella hongkongensis]|uniref:Glycoside hydrolase N-terminal domain-containing protein n=1 Tax=Cohnella hongkongensis TaxID=178337 RepID=A0ABV9F6Z5_9BACL